MRAVRPAGTIVPPEVGKTETDVLDHGPVTFGNWSEVELKAQDTLVKEFAFSGKGRVLWKIFSVTGGTMTVLDEKHNVVNIDLKRGENTLEIPVSDIRKSSFTVLYVPEKVFAACDYQRDYGRSRFNGRVLSAEWVVRCRTALEKNAKRHYNK